MYVIYTLLLKHRINLLGTEAFITKNVLTKSSTYNDTVIQSKKKGRKRTANSLASYHVELILIDYLALF